MHPMVFNWQINLLGWGPSISLFIWDEPLRDNMQEFGWRYFRIQRGLVDLTVQWI